MMNTLDKAGNWFHHSGMGAVCKIVSSRKVGPDREYAVLTFDKIRPDGVQCQLDAAYGLDGWTPITSEKAQRLIARYQRLSAVVNGGVET